MGRHSNNLTPIQAACLLALRAQLRNLEKTVASLLQLAIAQPEGPDRLECLRNAQIIRSYVEFCCIGEGSAAFLQTAPHQA